MPVGTFQARSLTLLGVGNEPSTSRLFDLGGIGAGIESSRIFDIQQAPVASDSSRVFDLLGGASSDSSRIFDLLGSLQSESSRVFDIIASSGPAANTRPGWPITPGGTVVNATLSNPAASGDTTITLSTAPSASTGALTGQILNIDGEFRAIASVAGASVSLRAPLGAAHSAGAPVTDVSLLNLEVLANAAAATDSLVLSSNIDVAVGAQLTVGGNTYTVLSRSIDRHTVYLTTTLSAPVTAGTYAYVPATFLRALSVFDKTGAMLGLIRNFTVRAARSQMIGQTGSFEFLMPRNAPDQKLIAGDWLVAVGSSEGLPLWAGPITGDQGVDSQIIVTCADAFSLMTKLSVKLKEELPDGTLATAVYQKIVNLMNIERGVNGELQWGFDGTGSKLYYGDVDWEGDPIDAFNDIAMRSNTEYAWQATIGSDATSSSDFNALALSLVVRDKFDAGVGPALSDGVSGNIAARPTYVSNLDTVVNTIKLSGAQTNIAKYAPEWAQWGVNEFQPFIQVSVNPGTYRRRKDLSLSVNWGLSKKTQQALADKTVSQMRALYLTYVYAKHDQLGRPNNEGWSYAGPPAELEAYLNTGLGWRTRRALVEQNGEAASSVMYSKSEGQILMVLYNRLTAEQTIRRSWFSEVDGVQYLTKLHVNGRTYEYSVVGGVITGRSMNSFVSSSALVTSHAMTLMWPGVKGTSHPYTTYHTLRRVISLSEDGAVTEGVYFDTGYVTGPAISGTPYIYLTLEPAPDSITLDQSYITKIYDFEERRIKDWDPRRDGVGAQLNRRSIVNNAPSTQQRWFIVPWDVPGQGQTGLSVGINATTTTLWVDSIFSLPDGNSLPYTLVIDEPPVEEKVSVTGMEGTKLTVIRAVEGSTASDHEPGALVQYKLPDGVEAWNGFVVHQELTSGTDSSGKPIPVRQMLEGQPLWPEGEAWAADLLTRLQRPQTRLSIQTVNRDGLHSQVALGSRHSTTISTEGHDNGYSNTLRVIGYTIDEENGTMELLTEEYIA